MSNFSEDGLKDILLVLQEDTFNYPLNIEEDEIEGTKIWYLVYDNAKTKTKYRMCTVYEATDGSYDAALMAEIFVSTKELLKFLLSSFFDNRQNYKKAMATNSMMKLLLLDVFKNANKSSDKELVESLEPIFSLFNITGLANLFDVDKGAKSDSSEIVIDSHVTVVKDNLEITMVPVETVTSGEENNFA